MSLDRERQKVLDALKEFALRPPHMPMADYESDYCYRVAKRLATRNLNEALILISRIEKSKMPLEILRKAFTSTWDGRLELGEFGLLRYRAFGNEDLEYRKAVCAVCAKALWLHYSRVWFDEMNRIYPDFPGGPYAAIHWYLCLTSGAGIAGRWFTKENCPWPT